MSTDKMEMDQNTIQENAVSTEEVPPVTGTPEPPKKALPPKKIILLAVIAGVVIIAGILAAVFLGREPLVTQTFQGISCGVPESWVVQDTKGGTQFDWVKDGETVGWVRMLYCETGESINVKNPVNFVSKKNQYYIPGATTKDFADVEKQDLPVSPAYEYTFSSKCEGLSLNCCYLAADYGNGQAVVGLEIREDVKNKDEVEKLFRRIKKTLSLDENEEKKIIESCVADFNKAAEALDSITLTSKGDIQEVQKLFDSYAPAVQEAIPDGKKRIEEGQAEYNQALEDAAAQVQKEIDAIGTVTLEKEMQITRANNALLALPEEAKRLVSNAKDLESAAKKLEQLKEEKKNNEAIAEVEAAIEAIGEVTLEKESLIETAKEKYDELPEKLQEKVKNKDVLNAARNKYYDLKEAKEREDIKQNLLNNCVTVSFEQLARNPKDYDGKYIRLRGEIVQVIDNYTYRVNITQGNYYWSDTIYLKIPFDCLKLYDGTLLEDDIITIYGKGSGTKTYTTVLGASKTIPSAEAEMVILG